MTGLCCAQPNRCQGNNRPSSIKSARNAQTEATSQAHKRKVGSSHRKSKAPIPDTNSDPKDFLYNETISRNRPTMSLSNWQEAPEAFAIRA